MPLTLNLSVVHVTATLVSAPATVPLAGLTTQVCFGLTGESLTCTWNVAPLSTGVGNSKTPSPLMGSVSPSWFSSTRPEPTRPVTVPLTL